MRLDGKRRRAAEMFLMHAPLADIANELGRSISTVKGWIQFEQERNQYAIGLAAKIIRDRENGVIEKIIAKWLPLALSEELNIAFQKGKQTISLSHWEGAAKASEIVAKYLAIQAKINGLDSVKVDVQSNGMSLPEAIIKAVRDFAVKPAIQATEVPPPKLTEQNEPPPTD